MEIQFLSAAEAFSATHAKLDADNDLPNHVLQSHIPISLLPSPSEALSLPSPPVEIRSSQLPFDIKSVANLWFQLLSIQLQNGNFVKYNDLVKNLPSTHVFDELRLLVRKEESVIRIRRRLQDGFLKGSRERCSPTEDWELQAISEHITFLEEDQELDPRVIRNSKICKVLESTLGLRNIPGEGKFKFRSRCTDLLRRFNKLSESPMTETSYLKADIEEEKEAYMLLVCLTQMSPDQCAKLEAVAEAYDPPVDRAVIELMCILPYLTDVDGRSDGYNYQIAPQADIIGQPRISNSIPQLNRTLYHGGPTLPSHLIQLTAWTAPYYGLASFLNTKTGEVIDLKDFEPHEAGVCEKFEGRRIGSIEDVLREWIENFLTMKWIHDGGENIITHESRSIYFVKHKRLLQEFNWPASFPLPTSQYLEFTRRKRELYQGWLHEAQFDECRPMLSKWDVLSKEWRDKNVKGDFQSNEYQGINWLDNKILEAFRYYYEQQEDREYAIEENVLMLEKFRREFVLEGGGASGSTWSIKVTTDDMMKRFKTVMMESLEADDDTARDMKQFLEKAYELSKCSSWEKPLIEMPDVDSTSDYQVSESECSEEEEFESDEDMEDLDAAVLIADMEVDVEMIRAELE